MQKEAIGLLDVLFILHRFPRVKKIKKAPGRNIRQQEQKIRAPRLKTRSFSESPLVRSRGLILVQTIDAV